MFHPLLVILTHSVYTQALAPEAKLSASSISSNHSSHTTSSSPAHHCPPFPCRCAAYEKGGPAAEARFEAGVAGFEARAFRGCGIMTSEPFEVSDDQDSVQMLTRNSQIGEFYVLQPPQVKPDTGKEKFTCDALIYDEESDRHVRVTWAQALAACCIDDLGDAEMSHPTGKMADANKKKLSQWKEAAALWTEYNKGGGTNYDALDADIRIVVARPFIEHLMHSVVMAVSGRDTGATLFGPADMQLSANTQVKTIEGHYTGHFKAVVTKPQNVLVRANPQTPPVCCPPATNHHSRLTTSLVAVLHRSCATSRARATWPGATPCSLRKTRRTPSRSQWPRRPRT